MRAKKIGHNKEGITLEIKIPFKKSLLEAEEEIQKSLNEAGCIATGEAIKQFDTDGSPIVIGGQKLTVKTRSPKVYETPYGKAKVERYTYQGSRGGRMYCPLEEKTRMIYTATPKMAKMLSSKYAEFGGSRVQFDLEENHGIKLEKSYIQLVNDAVGSIASVKESYWEYELPKLKKTIETISISLDGTCVLMAEDGYRQAMVGTIGLYDKEGERQHTVYAAASPEYGKEIFLKKLTKEVERIKAIYPNAYYIGIADGAKDNWPFLEKHTQEQLLDFYHASEYIADAGKIMHKNNLQEQEKWISTQCHNLKHEEEYIKLIYKEIKDYRDKEDEQKKLSIENRDRIRTITTYLKNNKHRMEYAQKTKKNIPIGSGVTEAACKVIVKQRLGGSGMKWKKKGATTVLLLRCLLYTKERWNQFWENVDRFGIYYSLNTV